MKMIEKQIQAVLDGIKEVEAIKKRAENGETFDFRTDIEPFVNRMSEIAEIYKKEGVKIKIKCKKSKRFLCEINYDEIIKVIEKHGIALEIPLEIIVPCRACHESEVYFNDVGDGSAVVNISFGEST